MDGLQDLRKQHGIGQIHLSRTLGVPQQYVSFLETSPEVPKGDAITIWYLRGLLATIADRAGCWEGRKGGKRSCGCVRSTNGA